jgi:hypothetical protein
MSYNTSHTGTSELNLSGNLVNTKKFSGNAKSIKEVQNFMVDIVKRNKRLSRHELSDWVRARAARYSVNNPSTYMLIQLYEDAMKGGHITAVSGNRTLRTSNKEFVFNDTEGLVDKERSKFIQKKKWFYDIIKFAHQSIYYQYSLILIAEAEKGNIKRVINIDREFINPEYGLLLKEVTDTKGLPYEEFPNELLYAELGEGIGLLEKAVPYAILKRHSWSSWDEFEELFGVPIRIAKIASQSDAVKKEVAAWLDEMGSAPYGVFPMGTEVEIKENSKADAFNVFYKKLEALDGEISKLFLHQTMTTDNGSSKSQAEVHQNTLTEVVKDDEKNILSYLNDKLIPVMRYYGYDIPEGYSISVSKTVNPKEKIEIDNKLMKNGYVLKQSYVEETYGVEIEYHASQKQKGEKDEKKKP